MNGIRSSDITATLIVSPKMLCHYSTYRGYTIGAEQRGSDWFITVSPKTPDLPILHRYCTETRAKSEPDAIAEAKSKVDKAILA